MLKFYEKEVAKSTKQIEFALCGFVGEVEGIVEALESNAPLDRKLDALDRMQDALDAIDSLRHTLKYDRERFAEELAKEKAKDLTEKAEIADAVREESIGGLLSDGEKEAEE